MRKQNITYKNSFEMCILFHFLILSFLTFHIIM